MNKHDLIVLLKRVITCNQFWYSKDRQIRLGHILQKYWVSSRASKRFEQWCRNKGNFRGPNLIDCFI